MDEQALLTLVSLLLKDKERVRWTEEFLHLAYEVATAEGSLTYAQELASILELCAAYDISDDVVRTINWVRRAAAIQEDN